MAVKLHRCSLMFVKIDAHPCWRVQKALDEQGIEYEVVKAPLLPPRRQEVERISGQKRLPMIEFPDGTAYRGRFAAEGRRVSGVEVSVEQLPEDLLGDFERLLGR